MEICGQIMQQCLQTKEFIQPESVLKYKAEENAPQIFDENENKINQRRCMKKNFYDATICRHLCSTSLVLKSKKTTPSKTCEDICFELTRSSKSAAEICPYQKYCAKGCPCKHYVCEKNTEQDQKLIPVWDLESRTMITKEEEDEFEYWNSNIFQRNRYIDRLPSTSWFNASLYDFHSQSLSSEINIKQDDFFPHEWIINYVKIIPNYEQEIFTNPKKGRWCSFFQWRAFFGRCQGENDCLFVAKKRNFDKAFQR